MNPRPHKRPPHWGFMPQFVDRDLEVIENIAKDGTKGASSKSTEMWYAAHNVACAYRALVASLPRLWDAESIGGAPDADNGLAYRVRDIYGDWSSLQTKTDAVNLMTSRHLSTLYVEAYGPYSQPPVKEGEGSPEL